LKEDDHVRNCIAPANFNQIRNYNERKINTSNISSKLKINAEKRLTARKRYIPTLNSPAADN
jgi:hypothetical protein